MPLSIHKRGGIWHYRGTVAGRRLRGSTRTADKATAQRIAADTEQAAWKGHLDGPAAVLTFAQAAILYRKAGRPTRFLERIENHWRDAPVKTITAGAIKQAAVVLYPRASGATRNRQVIVPTLAIINHAAELELCSRLSVRRFPVERKERDHVTREWALAFAAHASPHLGALCIFMFATGARITEALSVLWGDVDLAAGTVLIRQTKIGAERRAHLPPSVVAAMANIESNRNQVETVFRYSSKDTVKFPWMAAVERAGIKRMTPHCCRHGFATGMLRAGVDAVTVAKLGGWKSPQHVLSTYGHAMDDLTLTNRLFGTPETQSDWREAANALLSSG